MSSQRTFPVDIPLWQYFFSFLWLLASINKIQPSCRQLLFWPVCFAANYSLPSHQRWQSGAKGEAALPCLLGANVDSPWGRWLFNSQLLPPLMCLHVLIFPFTSWWKGTQYCYKSLWRSHALADVLLFLIFVIAVVFWPHFSILIYRFHSFHATNLV